MTWKSAIQLARYRWALLFCAATLTFVIFYMPTYYQEVIQPKAGTLLNDFVLGALTPRDWSLVIFIILYVTALHTVFTALQNPQAFVIGLSTYCTLSLLRPVTMYLVTFEPPDGMILLVDPITAFLVYPDSTFAKDLFFSGHVSTLMVMVLIENHRTAKVLKIIGTTIVGVLLAWQHVHYTIDLLAAPVVTYLVFLTWQNLLAENVNRPNSEGKKAV